MTDKTLKIMVVDDEHSFRKAVADFLEANGYRTAQDSSALSAIRTIATENPDLILLDLRMKKVGGIEMIRAMRRKKIDIPVVVISAYLSQENFWCLRKLGIEYFLAKPVDSKTLLSKIKEAVEHYASLKDRVS